jgi:DNA-binding NarL/FixJ family response regulator
VDALHRVVGRCAAELDAGVDAVGGLEFALEDKIAEQPFRRQERILFHARGHGADNRAVAHGELRLAAELFPAGQRFAVEERNPLGLARGERTEGRRGGEHECGQAGPKRAGVFREGHGASLHTPRRGSQHYLGGFHHVQPELLINIPRDSRYAVRMDEPAATKSNRKIRVLIVEDQITVREMLAAVLGAMPEFVVVAEAGDVDEALRLARRVQPDVVVLDWVFPGGGGAGFLRAMQATRLQSQVLVMSASTEEGAIREALTNGARGYIEKVADLEDFMRALRTVAAGGVFFGPAVASVVERLVKRPGHAKPAPVAEPSAAAAGNAA